MGKTHNADDEVRALGRIYMWWDALAGSHSQDRIIAQVMNLGTYDDMLRLEQAVGRTRLLEVMQCAQPGWFSNRSWEFWRSRLTYTTGATISDVPPWRSYDAPDLFAIPVEAPILQDAPDTLVAVADHGGGRVKLSFFGGIRIGRVADPLWTEDGVLLVASLDDLMATKLKATQDRAEAKDYRDIAAMIAEGVSLARGLSAVRKMFNGEPAQILRALGY